MTEKWFNWLQDGLGVSLDPTVYFFDMFKRPVKEIRPQMALMLKNLARLSWAHEKLASLVGYAFLVFHPKIKNNILCFDCAMHI